MGFFKVKKPTVLKEFVRPAYMIKAAGLIPLPLATLPQDAAQATTYPLIQAENVHL